ncbi:MAG: hypothetical protein HC845_00515 [Akkermansiaceae bacterium]|nr:hypothetical protein [Akkermansiaceae bacterium]
MKTSRRERQRKEAEVVPAGPSALEKKKAAALDLFAEEKKPKVKKTTRTAKSVLGTISKKLDKQDPAVVVTTTPLPPPEVVAPVGATKSPRPILFPTIQN